MQSSLVGMLVCVWVFPVVITFFAFVVMAVLLIWLWSLLYLLSVGMLLVHFFLSPLPASLIIFFLVFFGKNKSLSLLSEKWKEVLLISNVRSKKLESIFIGRSYLWEVGVLVGLLGLLFSPSSLMLIIFYLLESGQTNLINGTSQLLLALVFLSFPFVFSVLVLAWLLILGWGTNSWVAQVLFFIVCLVILYGVFCVVSSSTDVIMIEDGSDELFVNLWGSRLSYRWISDLVSW